MKKFSRKQLESMDKMDLIVLVESLVDRLNILDQDYLVLEDEYNEALEELQEFRAMLY